MSCCTAGFQQDHIIRVYESSNGYAVRKNVHARNLRWTITDCDVSPSEAFMVYCSITPTVHMVRDGALCSSPCHSVTHLLPSILHTPCCFRRRFYRRLETLSWTSLRSR